MTGRKRFTVLLSAIVVTLALPAAVWSQILIDDFTDTNAVWPLVLTAPSTELDGPIEPGISGTIGGNRTTLLGAPSMVLEGADQVQARILAAVASGIFDYTSTTGAEGALRFSYTFAPTDFSMQHGLALVLLGYDMPASQPQSFMVKFANGGPTVEFGGTITAPGAQTVELLFPQHVRSWIGITAVDGLSIEFSSLAQGTDMRIDSISTTIPEPATMGLLGMGLVALLAKRRRGR